MTEINLGMELGVTGRGYVIGGFSSDFIVAGAGELF